MKKISVLFIFCFFVFSSLAPFSNASKHKEERERKWAQKKSYNSGNNTRKSSSYSLDTEAPRLGRVLAALSSLSGAASKSCSWFGGQGQHDRCVKGIAGGLKECVDTKKPYVTHLRCGRILNCKGPCAQAAEKVIKSKKNENEKLEDIAEKIYCDGDLGCPKTPITTRGGSVMPTIPSTTNATANVTKDGSYWSTTKDKLNTTVQSVTNSIRTNVLINTTTKDMLNTTTQSVPDSITTDVLSNTNTTNSSGTSAYSWTASTMQPITTAAGLVSAAATSAKGLVAGATLGTVATFVGVGVAADVANSYIRNKQSVIKHYGVKAYNYGSSFFSESNKDDKGVLLKWSSNAEAL